MKSYPRRQAEPAILILIAGLALLLPTRGWAAPPAAIAADAEWKALDARALEYFRTYLRFDTSNPPGDTTAAIAYLKSILDQEGIATQTYQSAPGKVALLARIPGPAGVKPLLLMSHADVVPAVAGDWKHPPFGGDLAAGFVWGRGAIDNKGPGIMDLMTLIALQRRHLAMRRGVEMLVDADEEVGGALGAQWMVNHQWDALAPAFAINEGGNATLNWFGSRGLAFRVAVAEKRVYWLRLVAHGHSGHGSEPNDDNPNLILVRALGRVLAAQPALRLTTVSARELSDLAPRMPFPASFELAYLDFPLMLRFAAAGPLSGYVAQTLLRDTIALTMLDAGFKANVIPARAQATLDCRLLPDTDSEAFLNALSKTIADPRIVIEFIQTPEAEQLPSPANGPAWDAIAGVVGEFFPGALTVPVLMAGGTDSRFLREKNVPAYGFDPIVLESGELARIHGTDERLSVKNLLRGVHAMYALTLRLCAAAP